MIEQKYIDAYLAERHYYKAALGRHLHVFKAYVNGAKVEHRCNNGDWQVDPSPNFHDLTSYHIKAVPPPIEVDWSTINPKYIAAAADEDNEVFFYGHRPTPEVTQWGTQTPFCRSPLIHKTHYTDWRESLTLRPETKQ